MDFRQLRYFQAVARHGSMTAAGRALHISQPALGEKIRQLEQELGVSLLERHSRGVRLSPAGTQLIEHAERILSALEEARRAMAPLAKAKPMRLTIGLNPTASRLFTADLLEAFGAMAHIRLKEATSNEIQSEVAAGRIDAGFSYDPPVGTYGVVEIHKEPLHLVGAAQVVSSKADVPFDELHRFSLVLDSAHTVMRSGLEETARRRGIELNVAYEVEPVALKRRLLLRHAHCAIVPHALFAEDIAAGILNARRIVKPQLRRRLCLIIRDDLDTDAVRLVKGRIMSLSKAGRSAAATKSRPSLRARGSRTAK